MKEYDVYFSYYSEQYGSFDDMRITVEADNQFEARQKAWKLTENNSNFEFTSCVKLCGVQWKASPLDMQDYLNAQASYDKYMLQRIENVDKPNARIENKSEQSLDIERKRSEHYGSLFTINNIASDIGRPHGMKPPALQAELHYAREFLNLLYNDYDKYSAFQKKIERAEKWDSAATLDFRELLKYGYINVEGESLNFSDQLGKDGLCPIYANREDSEYQYVQRWTNAREYKSMDRLPFFDEKDIIADSQTMQYDYQILVIKKEALLPENQTPVNSLWIANQSDENGRSEADADGFITVENAFTGQIVEWERTDFLGVIRPEKDTKIDYDAIKAEYLALNAERVDEKTERVTEEKAVESGKPSILADVQKKVKEISENSTPNGDKKTHKKEAIE